MSGNGHCFVEWKEEFVSQERGNRVVHYFLKGSSGESVRAVIGTERSVRHMFYVVAEEFVRDYGPEYSIHAGFKWRSRREVVDWLTSTLSKQHQPGESPKHDEIRTLGYPETATRGISSRKTQVQNDMGRLSRCFNGHNSDIVWSGVPWICGKQLKHYPAFCRNGTIIAIQSFVFVMAKGEHHYLAYLEDMYEDKRGQKKAKVRWFHHNKEVKGVIAVRNPHPKEVFITPYLQVISAECIDGPATILTREHYENCLASFPNSLLSRVHLCSRQFKSNRVKPFDLSKLRGYYDQPILSCLNSSLFVDPDSINYGLNEEDEEELSPSENVKLGTKRTRSGRSCQRTEYMGTGRCMMDFKDSYRSVVCGLSGKQVLTFRHVENRPCYNPAYKVDEKIELLCQDSGIRGCWFRCTILQVSRKQMKVQYEDIRDEEGYGNLEEWVPACKLAALDKLGMRYSGRPTIRPAPPSSSKTELALEVGAAVDAWWSDGWWEGVVTGVDNSADASLQVYFPGENIFLNMDKKDLRISRDWVGDKWLDIEAKPDIHSAISAAISPDTKVCVSSTVVKDVKSDGSTMSLVEVPNGTKINAVEEEKPSTTMQASSDNHLEHNDCNDNKKLQLSTMEKDGAGGYDKKSPLLKNEVNSPDSDKGNVILCKLNETEVQNRDDHNNDSDHKQDELEVMECDTSRETSKASELVEMAA